MMTFSVASINFRWLIGPDLSLAPCAGEDQPRSQPKKRCRAAGGQPIVRDHALHLRLHASSVALRSLFCRGVRGCSLECAASCRAPNTADAGTRRAQRPAQTNEKPEWRAAPATVLAGRFVNFICGEIYTGVPDVRDLRTVLLHKAFSTHNNAFNLGILREYNEFFGLESSPTDVIDTRALILRFTGGPTEAQRVLHAIEGGADLLWVDIVSKKTKVWFDPEDTSLVPEHGGGRRRQPPPSPSPRAATRSTTPTTGAGPDFVTLLSSVHRPAPSLSGSSGRRRWSPVGGSAVRLRHRLASLPAPWLPPARQQVGLRPVQQPRRCSPSLRLMTRTTTAADPAAPSR